MTAVDRMLADSFGSALVETVVRDEPGFWDHDRELLAAWHQFQHAYQTAPRTRPGGRIIGGIICRPQLDAMATTLAHAGITPTWPLARCHASGTCCPTPPHHSALQ